MSEKSLKERFQEKLQGSRWTGSTNNIGYPKMKVDGEMVLGSHVALQLAGRKVPTGGPAGGKIVMHKDNNKLNLSPSNLEVGTHKENLKQMRDEGRDRPRGVHQEPDEKVAAYEDVLGDSESFREKLRDKNHVWDFGGSDAPSPTRAPPPRHPPSTATPSRGSGRKALAVAAGATIAGAGALALRRHMKKKKEEAASEKSASTDIDILKFAFKLQGEMEFQDIPIAIENRKGSVRKGTDKDGKPWRTVMKMPYGYIKGSKGADGEDIDCYVGPHKNAPNAYVVHQRKSDGTGYDEDKVLLGLRNKEEATKGYLAHYNSDKFLGPVKEVPVERLKEMLSTGKKLEKISSSLCARVLRRG